jgi:hypothetical protein
VEPGPESHRATQNEAVYSVHIYIALKYSESNQRKVVISPLINLPKRSKNFDVIISRVGAGAGATGPGEI